MITREPYNDREVEVEYTLCNYSFILHSSTSVRNSQVCPVCHNEEIEIIDCSVWGPDDSTTTIPRNSKDYTLMSDIIKGIRRRENLYGNTY